MLVGEVTDPTGVQRRIGIIGSCRLHDPLKAAVLAAGGRFVWSAHNAFTHSPQEAVQHLRMCLGQMEIPDPFAPYTLRQDHSPLLPPTLPELVRSCDTIVAEVSTFELLSCGGYVFNQDYFMQTFVRGKGLGVLGWFRDVGTGAPPAEKVAAAEAEMREAGVEVTPSRREILRALRKRMPEEHESAAAAAQLAALSPRLVLVPIFTIVGGQAKLEDDRRAIAERLRTIAAGIGADFVDPTPVLTKFGPQVALDGNGADIYHYAPGFLATMGKALLDRILRGPQATLEIPSGLVAADAK